MNSDAVATPTYVAGTLRLEPYPALRLRPTRVGDPASVRLYARPYRNVSNRIETWLARGDLIRDREPALYVHEYTSDGVTIRGVVGALDLSQTTDNVNDAVVLPHEEIHPEQAGGLASRLDQMGLHPTPILLTQRSPSDARQTIKAAIADPPTWSYDDRAGQRHRIWPIRDRSIMASLNDAWGPTRALIADGHHRYAAYLHSSHHSDTQAASHGLAMLIDQSETPLQLGAIHRTLHSVPIRNLRRAGIDIGLTWCTTTREQATASLEPDAIVITDGATWHQTRLPLTAGTTAVEFLHNRLLPSLRKAPQQIGHHHNVESAVSKVRRHQDAAIILPAITIDQVWDAVTHHHLLPEKATSFQPKPNPGVLIRPLEADVSVH